MQVTHLEMEMHRVRVTFLHKTNHTENEYLLSVLCSAECLSFAAQAVSRAAFSSLGCVGCLGHPTHPLNQVAGRRYPFMQKLRVPPRHSILLKANHYIIGKVRSMHTYYRCGKVTDTQMHPNACKVM